MKHSSGEIFVPGWWTGAESGTALVLTARPGGEFLVSDGNAEGHDFSTTCPECRFGGVLQPGESVLSETVYGIGRRGDMPVLLATAPADAPAPAGFSWMNARSVLGGVDGNTAMEIGRALMLTAWNADHAFCGRCGEATEVDETEPARVCPKCGFRAFPVVSPAMIARVTRGDRILLAHNKRFPDGVYSCVAGFVDAGESAEQAVIREIREEVGLDAVSPRYIASQPWPFPHSLMLAFDTSAEGEPVPDGVEITDARWFSADDMPLLPGPGSIARAMIESWLAGDAKKT